MSQVKARKSHKTKSRHASSRSQTNFPLLVVLGGFVLVAAALFALWKTGQPAAASVPIEVQGIPSLKVNQEKIDFGDIKLGRTVTASFTLSNVGDKILRITEDPYVDVVEGCWPPVPTIGSMVLKPGQQTTLSMSFMMHAGMEGPHDFRVHIPSNDPNQGDKELVVLSNWVP